MPAYVMTKSALPLRDIKKWKDLNEVAGATLFVSLTMLDNELGRLFEPRAALPSKRLEMIKAFKEAGMSVVVLAMPFMPYITDTPGQINALYSKLKDLKVDAVLAGGMTLRPGCQKEHFFKVLQEYDPSLLSFYKNLYRENKASGSPLSSYISKHSLPIAKAHKEHGLLALPPHKLYQNRLQIYDELWVLLTHMLKMYSRRGVNVDPLKASRKKYGAWLESQKKAFNRNRSLSGDDLDSRFQFMIQTGEFHDLIENAKLADFLIQVILERKTLNYESLKLE